MQSYWSRQGQQKGKTLTLLSLSLSFQLTLLTKSAGECLPELNYISEVFIPEVVSTAAVEELACVYTVDSHQDHQAGLLQNEKKSWQKCWETFTTVKKEI